MSLSIAAMRRTVQAEHGCSAEHLQSTLVHEEHEGRTVWSGQVEIFRLSGHHAADRAYAWVHEDGTGERYFCVLNLPPVNSALDAVQAVLAKSM